MNELVYISVNNKEQYDRVIRIAENNGFKTRGNSSSLPVNIYLCIKDAVEGSWLKDVIYFSSNDYDLYKTVLPVRIKCDYEDFSEEYLKFITESDKMGLL